MPAVTIYTTPTCPYCKLAKEFLRERGIPFTEKDVASDRAALDEMAEKSYGLSVPVIDIDGNIIVGFARQELARRLEVAE